jgi:hypothetical protein
MADTFGTLKNRILSDSKRDSSYLAPIGDAIVSAIRRYEHMRIWLNSARTSLTLTSTSDSVALPSDLKAINSIKLIDSTGTVYSEGHGFNQMTLIELEEIQYISPKPTQRPDSWAVEGLTLYVDSLADADYTIILSYFKKDASYPSADSDTSIWFADEAIEMIRYQAMAIFEDDHLHNQERAMVYQGKAELLQARLETENTKRYGKLSLK